MASANPAITPAEVAAAVGVSRDYARTLLRRARKRATGVECVTQPTVRNATRVAQPAPVLSAINLTPRARALHFLAEGDTPQQAAAKLGVPVGEVEFISKVDRLLNPAT
jgi:DNA-binding CsgD family transcriptional regulator